MYDVIIAGGGIAGMSAALILGRSRRNVLVCDTGAPRNWASDALHGFLSRDGIHPLELRRIARAQLKEYPSVVFRQKEVTDAQPFDGGYRVFFADGTSERCRYLLIATGVVDRVPDVEGFSDLYGQSVFHCPYCDGWELRDQPIAVYGSGEPGAEYALELTGWSDDVVLCLDGGPMPGPGHLELLELNGVKLRGEKIVRLEANGGMLERIVFARGEPLPRRAVFFSPDQFQASPLAEKLGCTVTGGVVQTAKLQQTHERMFVAGDAARSVQFAIVAAAEGAEAAFAINNALIREMLKKRE